MAHKTIEIPGGTTSDDEGLAVLVTTCHDQPTTLSFRYLSGGTEEHPIFGEIIFTNVFEYRWKADFAIYEDYAEHDGDGTLGLIEIISSRYIEAMASKGRLRNHPGIRLGLGVDESQVRHFRIGVDDHGRYDIIALNVSIREIAE